MIALHPARRPSGGAIGEFAADCLKREAALFPKPGLVSRVDNGAHDDMDFALMERSADALAQWFALLAQAGAAGAGIGRLRAIGIDAEAAMMAATGGVNTHRGAIFGLGLLAAAAGFRERYGAACTLGEIVAGRWGAQIAAGPVPLRSHGTEAGLRHGVRGARGEAAAGFPSLHAIALPALREGRRLGGDDADAAPVHALMALVAAVSDTNLLHRGGADGLTYAQARAAGFLRAGGVGAPGWKCSAVAIHRDFVARRLSPGGCADLLAMALFLEGIGE